MTALQRKKTAQVVDQSGKKTGGGVKSGTPAQPTSNATTVHDSIVGAGELILFDLRSEICMAIQPLLRKVRSSSRWNHQTARALSCRRMPKCAVG